ncbi:MAG TPA: restriction endonuclease subunit S [Burkholderiales bacterium]|jgi:type I restriction enzyme S subunit|nr:restriction endonuclease subunit S [Burkholderiales bacterium]
MRLETFFEKFDQLAEAPNAVVKMRALVLQLAVQGKLVEQQPTEGDADSLLKAIAVARKKDGRGKSNEETEVEELADVEGWHQVPASWRWVRLRTVGDIVGGGTPRSDNPAYFADEGIPWLTPADLNGFKAKRIHRGRRCITRAGLADSSARLLPAGSVLFSSRAPIGYVAIAGTELATNQGFKSCVPFICETNEFLYYYLMSAAARIDREASGTTFREVSGKIVNQIPVPLPPLAEQKRIVAKVDELMALCDRLEAQQLERETRHAALARASLARFADAPTPANLHYLFHPSYTIPPADLRKSILTLAVQGKLVPQDPNDEPAEDCLSRLGLKSTDTSMNGFVPENDALPPSWTRVRFEDIAIVAGGVTLGRKLGERKTVTLPYLRVANVKRGEIDISVIKEVSIPEDEIERYALRENDLLMTEGGDWDKVGRAAIWRAEIPICLHQNHVFRARMRSAELTPAWFERYFNSPIGRQYFESASKQTTNLASINMRQVRGCPVPLPPLPEQRRVVAKVNQLMALFDKLEMQIAASRAIGERLVEAMVVELTNQE